MADNSFLACGPLGDLEPSRCNIYQRWERLRINVRDDGRWAALHRWIHGNDGLSEAGRVQLWCATQWTAFEYAEAKAEELERKIVHQPRLEDEIKQWGELTAAARLHLHALENVLTQKIFDDGRGPPPALESLRQHLEMLEDQCPDWLRDSHSRGRPPLPGSANNLILTLDEVWKRYGNATVEKRTTFFGLALHAADWKGSYEVAEDYAGGSLRKALVAARNAVRVIDLPHYATGYIGKLS